jgi:predicted amidohydrolase
MLLVQVSTGREPEPNRETVRATVAEAVRECGPVDLVVLPEATQADFGDGTRPAAEVAEPLDGPFALLLGELAAHSGAVVVGGMFESTTDRPYNTLLAVGPDGRTLAAYRKAHLYDAFGYRESDLLRAGEPAAAFLDVPARNGKGLRVGLQTCYDLRFPEQSRALVDAGAQLLLVPAAWLRGPGKEHHWVTLLAARAIENTVHVAGIGKVGGRYCGLTRLVDPMGVVTVGLAEQVGWVVADVDSERTMQVRQVNPSLANRRWRVVADPR